AEETFDGGAELAAVGQEPGYPVLDGIPQSSDRGCHHRPAVSHRLARDHPVALAARGDAHHCGALVVAAEVARRYGPEALRHRDWTGADDHARQSSGRLEKVLDPLLPRETPGEEHVRRLVRLADSVGALDRRRHDARVPRAELAGTFGEERRSPDREHRTTK